MKLHIKFFVALFALFIILLLPKPAAAQSAPGLYGFLSGGTSQLPAATTNQTIVGTITNNFGNPGTATNFVLNVGQYDHVGFTFTATGIAATTNVTVSLYKSFNNGISYEANPSFTYANINIGAATYTTNADLDVHGVTHLALVTKIIGTGGTTNTYISLNLKAPLDLSIAPGNYGVTPGTPIAVPNFP